MQSIYAILFLAIFHLVGLIGILSGSGLIIALTPVNLALSTAILLYFQHTFPSKHLIFYFFCFLTGLMVEIIGVNTGLIFGNYQYGQALGPKIAGTPFIIGVNWLLLVICVNEIINFLPISLKGIKAILGAATMVVFDAIMEPGAIKLGFWKWENNMIPFQNYLGWFLVSLLLSYLYQMVVPPTKNKVAFPLFLIQLLFFLLINIFYGNT